MLYFHTFPYFLIRFLYLFLCSYSLRTVPIFAEPTLNLEKIGRFVFRINFEISIFAYTLLYLLYI